MTEQRIKWLELGAFDDIPKLGSRRIELDKMKIGLFRTASDKIFAIEDKCPHLGGPLSEGIVHDNCVTCPLHNWVISLESGEAQGADKGCVKSFPIKIANHRIFLGVSKLHEESA